MKKYLAILVLMPLCYITQAQQLPFESQYMENMFFVNPAYAGVEKNIPVYASFRDQWVGFDNAPVSYTLSANTEFNKAASLGGIIFSDRTGPISQTGLELAYAYHLQISKSSTLSFGLAGVLNQHVLDESKLSLDQPIDKLVPGGKQKTFVPDATFGLYYYGKRYFVGLSIPQLIQSKVVYDAQTSKYNNDARHYYFMAGYKFKMSSDFDLEPSMAWKFVSASPMQFGIGFKGIYKKKYWLGLSYRDQDAVVVILGLKHKKFRFGYSYDFTTSELKNYSAGSHEIFIGYVFDKKDKSGKSSSQMDDNQQQKTPAGKTPSLNF